MVTDVSKSTKMAAACEKLVTEKYGREEIERAMGSVVCEHNDWDNVRVVRGLMTLRCRVCEGQWRAPVGIIWEVMYCKFFRTKEGCKKGDACWRLHINSRKLSLCTREKQSTCNNKLTQSSLMQICPPSPQEEEEACVPQLRSVSPQSHSQKSSSCLSDPVNHRTGSYCHNPYEW
eukprot:TRINITY_DN388_c0_g3_i2.p1 TRINITY_DN388_c0_g3~~TRINITY_DN388_c0_g3_i2.p1  ORF type:complete len:205 (+),score=54.03 TRINITY_DN388_c0_g3_i2:93-617(+)